MTEEEQKEFDALKQQLEEKDNTIKTLTDEKSALESDFNKFKEEQASKTEPSKSEMDKGAPFAENDPDKEFADLFNQMFKEK